MFPCHIQVEMINLQHNDLMKGKYQGKNLIEDYKYLIPSDEHAQVKSYAGGLLSVFGNDLVC